MIGPPPLRLGAAFKRRGADNPLARGTCLLPGGHVDPCPYFPEMVAKPSPPEPPPGPAGEIERLIGVPCVSFSGCMFSVLAKSPNARCGTGDVSLWTALRAGDKPTLMVHPLDVNPRVWMEGSAPGTTYADPSGRPPCRVMRQIVLPWDHSIHEWFWRGTIWRVAAFAPSGGGGVCFVPPACGEATATLNSITKNQDADVLSFHHFPTCASNRIFSSHLLHRA